MTFLAPDRLWLLTLVPLAAVAAAWVWRRRLAATAAWVAHGLWPQLLPGYRPGRLLWSLALAALALAALVLGLARPTWGLLEEEVERRGVDVVIALDVSLSMAAIDVAPSRLEIARSLVRELVRALPGSRIGLVQFEGEAQVLSPLTLDRNMVSLLLESMEPGALATPGSLIASGLGAALELLPPEATAARPVIVLVSDGEDTGDGWPAIARLLREAQVVVHTVAVGTPEGAPLPDPRGGGSPFKVDRQGRQVISRLEPEILRRLASASGGHYYEVRTAHTEIAPLRDALLAMEGAVLGTDTVVQRQERFAWFLGAAAALLTLQLLVGPFRGGGRMP